MNKRGEALPAVLLTVAVVAVLLSIFVGWPLWRVWQRELAGKAQLQEATWSRRIAVEEAQAKMDAAALLA
jgi:type II secretory pathway component PulK